MTSWSLGTSFTNFTLPIKEEGFDDVRYQWDKKTKCAEYVREWVLNRKLTTRVEDIQPSEWFTQKYSAWLQQLQKWHLKQTEWKQQDKKKTVKEPEKKEAEKAENGEKKDEEMEEKKEEKTEDAEKKDSEKKDDDEKDDADEDELDIFGVEDVCNMSNGEPLFANFTWEDWALLTLRFELYLLVHSFRRDVSDPERVGIHVDHLLFYYNKYFRKTFNTKYYGVETYEALVDFIRDTICINAKNSVLEAHISDELDSFDLFLKLAEESRRERNLLIDSGEESATLKFLQTALTQQPVVPVQPPAANAAALAALPQQPPRPTYPRGPRPPVQQGHGAYGAAPTQQKPSWGPYNAPQGQKGGSYYGGKGKDAGKGGYGGQQQGSGYVAPAVGQQYGAKRPYNNYGKGGYGR